MQIKILKCSTFTNMSQNWICNRNNANHAVLKYCLVLGSDRGHKKDKKDVEGG